MKMEKALLVSIEKQENGTLIYTDSISGEELNITQGFEPNER